MHWFGNYGSMMGPGFGGVFMVIFWILIVFLIVYVAGRLFRQGGIGEERNKAADILNERYARGEISREEYERIKEDLRR